MKKTAKFILQQALPNLTPGIGYGSQSVLNAAMGKPNAGQPIQDLKAALLSNVFGVKVRTVDLREEKRKYAGRMKGKEQLYNLLLYKAMREKGISKEEGKRAVSRLMEMQIEEMGEQDETIAEKLLSYP